MKTKLSKKLLSLLLAVMMVVTSIPLMAFSAFAADTDAVEAAIAAYQSKMNGTLYTNMLNAYNAYVDANEALDAYKYGGASASVLTTAANELTAATNAMTEWSYTGITSATPSFYEDSGDSAKYAQKGISNLLYSPQATDTAENKTAFNVYNSSNSSTGVEIEIWYANNTVMLYDGVNTPTMPVMAMARKSVNKDRYIYQIYPCQASSYTNNNDNFRLTGNWGGRRGNENYTHDWISSIDATAGSAQGEAGSASTGTRLTLARNWQGKYYWASMANVMQYKGTPTSTLTTFDSLNWYTLSGNDASDGYPTTTSGKIYVIDYKKLLDAADSRKSDINFLTSDEKYTQGGLAALISAYDAAIAVNPQSYDYASDVASATSSCSQAIDNAVNAINTAVVTADSGYADLRTAIDDNKVTFNGGAEGWNDAWGEFESAYNAAVAIFANIQSTSYNDSAAAKAAADRLVAARAALQPAANVVGTDMLEIIIKNADAAIANKNVFTADSYAAANLEALVAEAKATIWAKGEFDNASAKIDESEESIALVAKYENDIKTAVAQLKPNNDVTVASVSNYSLNSIMEYANTFNASEYANYSEVTKAVATARDNFIDTVVVIDATVPNSVTDGIALYQSNVKDIYYAILMLKPAFSSMPNGTIAAMTIGSTDTEKDSSGDIGYRLTDQITNITYYKTVGGTTTFTTEYDLMFDNNYSYFGTKGAQCHALGWGAFGQDTVAVQGGTLAVRYKEGGTAVLNGATGAYDYHSAVMKTDSNYTVSQDFVDIIAGTKNQTVLGETILTVGDLELGTAYTYTTPDIYGLFYFNANNYGGARTPVMTNLKQTITVIDISQLFELIKQCNSLNPSAYTTKTYSNLVTALAAAKAEMTETDPSRIASVSKQRYGALLDAYNKLEEATFNITFNYKDANGNDTSSTIVAKYGQTLNDFAAEIAAINTPDYIADISTYKFDSWSPELSTGIINSDLTYNAVYTSTLNLAVWDNYNNAKAQLLGSLTDKTFVTADIQAIADETAGMTYFSYDDAAKAATLASEQGAIDAETARLTALMNGLTPSTVTADAFDAAVAELNTALASVDNDRLDVSKLDKINYDTVLVGTVKVVLTIPYSSQTELDNATKAILEGLNDSLRYYSIKLNGNVIPGLESVAYGTAVIVNSDGTYKVNVTDTNENYDGQSVDWSYSYDAPSRNGSGFTTSKYIVTAPSFGFIVKGDTNLTSTAAAAESDDTYVVTVKSSTGKIIDVATTTGAYTMKEAPLYANWIFDSYSNGAAAGQQINVTEDTTIIANYTAKTYKNYHIDVFKSLADWQQIANMESFDKDYNTKVTLTADDVYCWTTAYYDDVTEVSYYSVVSYDKDYSFYACQSFDNDYGEAIVAISYSDYVSLVMDQTIIEDELIGTVALDDSAYDVIQYTDGTPILATTKYDFGVYVLDAPEAARPTVTALQNVIPVYNSSNAIGEFAMIGSFAVPEGYKVVEYGILFTGNTTSELSVENASTDRKVARYKASRYTVGNQFVINMANFDQNRDFRYRAYAIVQDANGNSIPYYSNVCSANNYSF